MRPSSPPIRWWPAALVLALACCAELAISLWPGLSHQQQNICTAQTLVYSAAALLLWVLAFSRLRWAIRWALLACVLVGGLAVRTLLTIRGVSGDLVPIVEWRHRKSGWTARLPASGTAPSTNSSPLAISPASWTNDYPQFLGPSRNSTVEGPLLARDWQKNPPQLLWRQPVGSAWSGFAIAGPTAVTLEQRGEEEVVVAYQWSSGRTLWTQGYAAHYHTTIAGEGPRTTPTIVGDRVYTMGAQGALHCLDLATGRVLWTKEVTRENHGELGEWGMSCSPLVVAGKVLVTTGATAGRSLVAYDAQNGEEVWAGGHDRASYSSPISATLAGSAQVLIFNGKSVAGHDLAKGTLLWEHPWPSGHPHITCPLILSNDQVIVSSGYGTGTELLQIQHQSDSWTVQRLWKSIRLKSKFSNLIQYHQAIYGLDDGIMVCLDAATGQLKWKEGRYGHGQMVGSGDLILVMAENGQVVLVAPNPEQHLELTQFQALAGKTWNPPALAGQCLLLRNDQEAACYWLPAVPSL